MLEATGRYERALVEAAIDRVLPIIAVNPIHVPRYAQAVGKLAKTDAIDAKLIAEFAEVVQPRVIEYSDIHVICVKDLPTRRRQLMGRRTMELNRLKITGQAKPMWAPFCPLRRRPDDSGQKPTGRRTCVIQPEPLD
ncbi:MAG: transposase [Gammaproteobacteria bacterium]|nr:transposase [Gammaproteobacteria bacterium]